MASCPITSPSTIHRWWFCNITSAEGAERTSLRLRPLFLSFMMRSQNMFLVFTLTCCVACSDSVAGEERLIGNFKSPIAVREVLACKRTVANAAWWGFDEEDSTAALQAAINSGASNVIVPYMGSAWIVRPIKLSSNQEIVFEPGVVVVAKKGEFKGKNDCLFSAIGKKNVTLRGYGATLRMWKEDYAGANYQQGQWRHVLRFVGCRNVKVFGLVLRDSGGDGIYLGQGSTTSPPCKDILIEDCICDNNYRQGISVISAEDLQITNCIFKNTSGHSPGAGIDIEPNVFGNKLSNIVVSNCVSENNEGRGFVVALHKLTKLSADISILFVDCYTKGCGRGLEVGTHGNETPKGLVEFKNCAIEDTLSAGIWIVTNARDFDLRFTNCKIKNANSASAFPEKKYIFSDTKYSFPIVLRTRRQKFFAKTGDIQFIDCHLYDKKPRPAIYVRTSGSGAINAKGTIYVQNKLAEKLVAGPDAEDMSLKIERRKP